MKLCIASLVLVAAQWLAVRVEGTTDCAPSTGFITLKTSQDIYDLSTCTKFTGNIVVAADGPAAIQLDGLQHVSGNIDIENVAGLATLSSLTLQSFSSLTLNNLHQLSNLSFPVLSEFSALKWYNLPSLEEATIAAGSVRGDVQEVTIWNTAVRNLEWLVWPVASEVNISQNANLQEFSIPYSTLDAGCAISVSANPLLKSVGVSNLTRIYGGLDISNNSAATQLDFSDLESISGFVQLSGSLTNISMPRLDEINGALSVKSTDDISMLCDDLATRNLAGHYDCHSNVGLNAVATTATGLPEVTSIFEIDDSLDEQRDKGPGKLSSSIKAAIAVTVIVFTILSFIAALFYLRRRLRSKVREIEHKPKVGEADSVELVQGDSGTPIMSKQLECNAPKVELESKPVMELDACHKGFEFNFPVSPTSPAYSTGSVNSVAPLVRNELPA